MMQFFLLLLTATTTYAITEVNNTYLRNHLNPLPANYKKNKSYTLGVLTFNTGGLFTALGELASCAALAVNEINNRTDILPTHNIDPYFKDSAGAIRVTLPHAMELIGNSWSGVTVPPIINASVILGPLRSSSSILANHIYELKSTPGVSATSTSVELSNAGKFPFFSRVIGSDAQQGTAMATFCHGQGWFRVAVLFTSDAYSSSITTEFLKGGKALVPNVEAIVATSFISGLHNDDKSYSLSTQASLIKNSKSIVIYAPLLQTDLIFALTEFGKAGLTKPPYIWLGADGWFNLDDPIPVGAIMSVPYTPPVNSNYPPVDHFVSEWNKAISRDETSNFTKYSIFCPYQYDAVFLIAYAMENVETKKVYCSGQSVHSVGYNSTACTQYRTNGEGGLLSVLMREVTFNGSTGPMKLDSKGDRLTAWGFNNKDGSTTPAKETLIARVDLITGAVIKQSGAKIFYPGEGYSATPPRSFPQSQTVTETVNQGLFAFVVVVSVIIMVLCVIAMVLAVYYREKPIMRLSSYRINNVTTMGIIICMVACVLYGVDEGQVSGSNLSAMSTLCVLRPWLFDMGFNIFFLPMFSKVYRVNRIFNQVVSVVIISDIELLSPVLVFCVIDFFILVVWTTVDPLTRSFRQVGSPVEDFTRMTITTTQVGVCGSSYDSVFYLILVLLKGIPSIYGALMAFQTRKVFIKAMRDSVQIGAILVLVVIIAAFEVAISFVIRDSTAEFALLSAGVICIAIATLGFVWGGKYYAIWTEQEDKWTSDPFKGKRQPGESTERTTEQSFASSNASNKLGKGSTGENSSPRPSGQERHLGNQIALERVRSDDDLSGERTPEASDNQ